MFSAVLLLGQASSRIDPNIAQDWTAAVATNLKSASIKLRPKGSFVMISVNTKGKKEFLRGTYSVSQMPNPPQPGVKQVQFFYDLESLRKVGMPKAGISALVRSGKRRALGMQLYYFPEVPVLTDIMTAHFVPLKGKEVALKRLAKWKPF